MKRSGIWWLIAACTLLALVVPPILVENTSSSSRVIWSVYLGLFVFTSLFAWLVAISRTSKIEDSESPIFKSKFGSFKAALIASFPAVVLGSVLVTNQVGQGGLLDSWAAQSVIFVGGIFPMVGKLQDNYGTLSWVVAEHGQVLKALTVISMWFVYGLVFALSIVILATLEGDGNIRSPSSVRQRDDLTGRPGMQFFCILFGVYAVASTYFGWHELEAATRPKYCLMHVRCYIRDDLAIIAAAMWKFFVIFGFGGGTVQILRGFLRDPFATTRK